MSKTVLLGLFDGLHRGHERAVCELLSRQGEKAVFTFKTKSLDTKGKRGLLMTDVRKEQAFALRGIEVYSVDFSQVRNMLPEEFAAEILRDKLGAKEVICGENFRFGRGGQATAEDLTRICHELGIVVTAVPLMLDEGEPVSTTRIRRLILEGDIEGANRLLGYRYGFEGEAFAVGETGFEICLDEELALPKAGKYLCRVICEGSETNALADIENNSKAKIRIKSGFNIKNGDFLKFELINGIDV